MKNELYHWGIKGQKWGLRRFQNDDGTLTPEGKERYTKNVSKYVRDGRSERVHAVASGVFGSKKDGSLTERVSNNLDKARSRYNKGFADITESDINKTFSKEVVSSSKTMIAGCLALIGGRTLRSFALSAGSTMADEVRKSSAAPYNKSQRIDSINNATFAMQSLGLGVQVLGAGLAAAAAQKRANASVNLKKARRDKSRSYLENN